LSAASPSLGDLSSYLAEARASRPELQMARAGVRARQAQLEAKTAGYYPNLGLGLSVDVAHGSSVTDQRNPFARDPINFVRYGAALVFDWKLDFLPQKARVDQARAQLVEVKATERYADGGVVVEVERAFREAEAAMRRMKTYEGAVKVARRWLISTQQGVEIGAYEHKDLADPAKEYALKRFAHMNAIYDYNMALSRLALATGRDETSPPPTR
jgi:outer membrane protein TolC